MSLAAVLWAYQAERFPLARTVPLLAVFSAASINVSAFLADRPLPGPPIYLAGFALALILFFQMRVCDEVKDAEDDAKYRPERPIPRGLVSLRTIVLLGAATVPVAAATALAAGVLPLLLLTWAWLAAMTFEFGVPSWLKTRPLLYLLSHMAIMPLIDLMLTGLEWRLAGGPAAALWLFLALSFANGVVLELGRKIWAPESERDGVETYSRLWGPVPAVIAWGAAILIAYALLAGIGRALGLLLPFALVGGLAAAAALLAEGLYAKTPAPRTQANVDKAAGLWVLVCYGSAGFLPLLLT
ncbi:MAG: UbiA family prenyltransferase [Paracoccaceae bacterium]|nr:UbiA family prenyltransferase [Paracoccaceae bacterium]